MHGACHKLFARTGLAHDENGRIRGRYLLYAPEHLLHLLTAPHDPRDRVGALHIALERRILPYQLPTRQNTFNNHQQFIVIKRLGNVIYSAEFHCLDCRTHARIRSHDQHRHAISAGDNFGSRQSRQTQIGDDQIEVSEYVACFRLFD